jgi:hypothetical protein
MEEDMSLLSDAMEEFVMLDKSTVADGYGGFLSVWTEGAVFNAAATFDSSIEARIAAVQGVTAMYTITTSRAINLQYHDVIKRASDGKIFRVTSDGDDKKTPKSAMLDMRQVTAEEWSLPNG